MSSLAMRAVSRAVRLLLRRRRWGRDARGTARRARRLFGVPPGLRWAYALGLGVERVAEGGVRGEWVVPSRALDGVVLYVHGGGFVACSAGTHRPVTAALARLTRRPVFAVDYRLAPEHPFPAAPDDVLAAYRWLLARGASAGRVAVAGDSAGGGLVLTLLRRARDAGLALPACGVCFSPWADLAARGATIRANDGRCAMFRPQNMPEFARAYLQGAADTDDDASPAYADLAGLPPLLVHVGAEELLRDDAERVCASARAAGGECRVVPFEGAFHAWQLLYPFVPEARASLEAAAAFVRDHLAADRRVDADVPPTHR